jgi:hypothetical protein
MKKTKCANGEELTKKEIEHRVKWLVRYGAMTRGEAIDFVKNKQYNWIDLIDWID